MEAFSIVSKNHRIKVDSLDHTETSVTERLNKIHLDCQKKCQEEAAKRKEENRVYQGAVSTGPTHSLCTGPTHSLSTGPTHALSGPTHSLSSGASLTARAQANALAVAAQARAKRSHQVPQSKPSFLTSRNHAVNHKLKPATPPPRLPKIEEDEKEVKKSGTHDETQRCHELSGKSHLLSKGTAHSMTPVGIAHIARLYEAKRQIHNASLHVRTDIKTDSPSTNFAIAVAMKNARKAGQASTKSDSYSGTFSEFPHGDIDPGYQHCRTTQALLRSYMGVRDEAFAEHEAKKAEKMKKSKSA